MEINKNDLKNPKEKGWYICQCIHSSITYYNNEESEIDKYCICNCTPKLLYWEDNVWLTNPKSFYVVENKDILYWEKVSNRFDIVKIRLNFND